MSPLLADKHRGEPPSLIVHQDEELDDCEASSAHANGTASALSSNASSKSDQGHHDSLFSLLHISDLHLDLNAMLHHEDMQQCQSKSLQHGTQARVANTTDAHSAASGQAAAGGKGAQASSMHASAAAAGAAAVKLSTKEAAEEVDGFRIPKGTPYSNAVWISHFKREIANHLAFLKMYNLSDKKPFKPEATFATGASSSNGSASSSTSAHGKDKTGSAAAGNATSGAVLTEKEMNEALSAQGLRCQANSNITLSTNASAAVNSAIHKAYDEITKSNRTIALIWTGDNSRKSESNGTTVGKDRIMKLNELIAGIFKNLSHAASPSIPVVPSVGSYDTFELNQLAAGPNENLDFLAKVWGEFIPADQLSVYTQGGYYRRDLQIAASEEEQVPMRLVSLNTMYFNKLNKLVSDCDVEGSPGQKQLAWLEAELAEAKAKSLLTYIVGDIVPSAENYYPACYANYSAIMEAYGSDSPKHHSHMAAHDEGEMAEDMDALSARRSLKRAAAHVIVGQFYGHYHSEELFVSPKGLLKAGHMSRKRLAFLIARGGEESERDADVSSVLLNAHAYALAARKSRRMHRAIKCGQDGIVNATFADIPAPINVTFLHDDNGTHHHEHRHCHGHHRHHNASESDVGAKNASQIHSVNSSMPVGTNTTVSANTTTSSNMTTNKTSSKTASGVSTNKTAPSNMTANKTTATNATSPSNMTTNKTAATNKTAPSNATSPSNKTTNKTASSNTTSNVTTNRTDGTTHANSSTGGNKTAGSDNRTASLNDSCLDSESDADASSGFFSFGKVMSLLTGDTTKAKEEADLAADTELVLPTASCSEAAHGPTNSSCLSVLVPNSKSVALSKVALPSAGNKTESHNATANDDADVLTREIDTTFKDMGVSDASPAQPPAPKSVDTSRRWSNVPRSVNVSEDDLDFDGEEDDIQNKDKRRQHDHGEEKGNGRGKGKIDLDAFHPPDVQTMSSDDRQGVRLLVIGADPKVHCRHRFGPKKVNAKEATEIKIEPEPESEHEHEHEHEREAIVPMEPSSAFGSLLLSSALGDNENGPVPFSPPSQPFLPSVVIHRMGGLFPSTHMRRCPPHLDAALNIKKLNQIGKEFKLKANKTACPKSVLDMDSDSDW